MEFLLLMLEFFGQSGTIKHISIDTKGHVTKIYVKFHDSKAGLKKINKDAFAKKHSWVPVEKNEVDIRMKSTRALSPVTKDFLEIDIIFLTKTRQSLSNSQHILQLPAFDMNFNNREDKFQSIALCSKNDIDIRSNTKFCGASYVTFVKSNFDSNIIKLLILYKKSSLPITNFCNWLKKFIFYNPVDIILGDFNINVLHENNRLLHVLSAYKQVVTKSTHISGSLLDHVYVYKEFSRTLSVNVIDIYFSDHDAVQFKFIWHFNIYNNLIIAFKRKKIMKYLKRFLFNPNQPGAAQNNPLVYFAL